MESSACRGPPLSVFGSIWCVSEGTNATMSIFVQQNAFKEGFHSTAVVRVVCVRECIVQANI